MERQATFSQPQLIARFLLLTCVVLGMHGLVLAGMSLPASTVTVDPNLWTHYLAMNLVFVLGGLVALASMNMRLLGSVLILWGLMLALGSAGILLTYVTYNLDRHIPLQDETLAAVDAFLLGPTWWRDMLQWFSARPVVNKLAYYCYAALIPQQFLAFVLLPLLGRIERAQTLMLAVALGLLVTHGLGYFVPALGAYPYYDITPAEHPGVSLFLGGSCAPEVAALRSGELIDLTQRRLVGLMAFPSFHAMSAVLVAWAFWSVPYLRWPALMLNVGMVLATPLHGSHYMCETVAGVLLAYPCLVLARRLLRPAGRFFAPHDMADVNIVWTPAPRRWFQSA